MNKKIWFIIGGILFLSACSSTAAPPTANSAPQQPVANSPRIPKSPTIPKLPEAPKPEVEDTALILAAIEDELDKPSITGEDIRRGWYYAGQNAKKYGTPSSWVFIEEGDRSRWASPTSAVVVEKLSDQIICEESGGEYQISCLESELPSCTHIPFSRCKCVRGALPDVKEGCLLVDDNKNFISVTPGELAQGYYDGKLTEKKKGTPSNWIWNGDENFPRWQNPGNN